MNRTIHTYGDSHATFYGAWADGVVDGISITGVKVKGFSVLTNHLGAKLVYSFGRDKEIVVNNVNPNDVVVFCLGEIDCRCHINKYSTNWRLTIDNLVHSYLENVKRNLIGKENITTCIFNVVPALERENPLNLWVEETATVPALGTDKERKGYTEYMNNKLKELCKQYGYVFIDVYDKYCNEKGYLKLELSDTNCHIRNPIYIEEFLEDKLNNKTKENE
jgi:hypothetical protein